MLRKGEIHKTYWALTRGLPEPAEAELTHYITTKEVNNKSYASTVMKPGSKEARLKYKLLARGNVFNLVEIKLLTAANIRYVYSCRLSGVLSEATLNMATNAQTKMVQYHCSHEK